MQNVDVADRCRLTYIFKAGLIGNERVFEPHIPEQKLEPLRMDHFYLGKKVYLLSRYIFIFVALLILSIGLCCSSVTFVLEILLKYMLSL